MEQHISDGSQSNFVWFPFQICILKSIVLIFVTTIFCLAIIRRKLPRVYSFFVIKLSCVIWTHLSHLQSLLSSQTANSIDTSSHWCYSVVIQRIIKTHLWYKAISLLHLLVILWQLYTQWICRMKLVIKVVMK